MTTANARSEILPQGAHPWPRWKKITLIIILFLALILTALYCYQRFFGSSGRAQTPPVVTTAPAPTPAPVRTRVNVPAKTPDSITVTESGAGKPNVTIEWQAGQTPSKRDQDYWTRCGATYGNNCR